MYISAARFASGRFAWSMPLARVARSWLPFKIIKVVHMAGGGASAAEIAAALGESDAGGVYAMLSRHGIALVPKLSNQVAFPIVLERRTFASITKHALAHDVELPAPPNFEAATHERFRPKLAELVKLAKAGDVAGLRTFPINPISSSPKAMARYRDLCVIALGATHATPRAD
jgi:hypothetical protein